MTISKLRKAVMVFALLAATVDAAAEVVETRAAGTLQAVMRQMGIRLDALQALTVKGPLNNDDIYFLRDSLSDVERLDLSEALCKELPSSAFAQMTMKEIKLPKTLEKVGATAFSLCLLLEEVEFPEGVRTFGSFVFNSNLMLEHIILPSTTESLGENFYWFINYGSDESMEKHLTVTCRAVVPPKTAYSDLIGNFGFTFCKGSLTLRVPSFCADAYKEKRPWKDFNEIIETDERPATMVLNSPATYSTDRLPADYTPNLQLTYTNEFNPFGSLVLEGSQPLHVKQLLFGANLADRWGSKSSNALVTTAPLTVDDAQIEMKMQANHWFFMSFPFDVALDEVQTGSSVQNWIVRSYSSSRRALGRDNQWVDVPAGSMLKAGQGYIWMVSDGMDDSQHDQPVTVHPAQTDNKNRLFASGSVGVPLETWDALYDHNRDWNFVGNPYPCYYDTRFLEQKMPFIVMDYFGYKAYSPVDDKFILSPFEAFFLQKPQGASQLTFNAEGRQVNNKVRQLTAARAGGDNGRRLVNLVLTDGEQEDRTRVVLNEAARMDYEPACDAPKMMSDRLSMPQLYTLVGTTPCAINERKEADGRVPLGLRLGNRSACTLALDGQPADVTVAVEDCATGTTTPLTADAPYTFTAEAGVSENRLVLLVSRNATGISDALRLKGNGIDDKWVYDLQGRRMDGRQLRPGIYIRDGRRIVVGN